MDDLKRFTKVMENIEPSTHINYAVLINAAGIRLVQEIIQEIERAAKERNLSVDNLKLPKDIKTKLYDAYAHEKLTLSDLIAIAHILDVKIHLTLGREEIL